MIKPYMWFTVVASVVVFGTSSALGGTRIQVLVSTSSDRAAEVARHLDDNGFGPALVSPHAKGWAVATKEFPTYADATFAKPALSGLGYQKVFATENGQAFRPLKQGAASGARMLQRARYTKFASEPDDVTLNLAPILGEWTDDSTAFLSEAATTATLLPTPASFATKHLALRESPPVQNPEPNARIVSQEIDPAILSTETDRGMLHHALNASRRGNNQQIDHWISQMEKKYPGSSRIPESRMIAANSALAGGDVVAAAKKFDAVRSDTRATQPVRSEAKLRLAYLALAGVVSPKQVPTLAAKRNSGKQSSPLLDSNDYVVVPQSQGAAVAISNFREVADGNSGASDLQRAEARLRLGALLRKGRDKVAAMEEFAEVADTAPDSRIRALGLMQQGATALELAYDGHIPYNQVRDLLDRVAEERSTAPLRIRSTAALMALECSARLQEWGDIIQRSEQFVHDFASTPEAPLVWYWSAQAYDANGDLNRAARLLTEILEARIDTSSRFARLNYNVAAKRLAQQVAQKLEPSPEQELLQQLATSP